MNWILLFAVAGSVGCRAASARVALHAGDAAPRELGASDSTDLLFVTTAAECFGCRIQGGFVALRAAQRTAGDIWAPRLTALLVARGSDDSLAFSRTLEYERIVAQIKVMTREQASRIFDLDRIPAIFLIEKGRVVREWESVGRRALGRDDITDALAEVRNGAKGQ